MPAYSDKDRETIVQGWAQGLTWSRIGELVPDANGQPRSAASVQCYASRMRAQGLWPDVEGVRESPQGRPGRPRNRVRATKVSPRFAVEVNAALREVADAAGMRLGEVLTAALDRQLLHVRGRPVAVCPLGLEPGKWMSLQDGCRSCTASCSVDRDTLAALAELWPEKRRNTIVYDAAVALLEDLHYLILEAD